MLTSPEPEPHHRLLHRRLKESFAPIYLTALSVIQGVALADLASVVLAGTPRFTITHWLLVVLSLAILIVIWNAYTVQTTLWDWIPDFRDSIIPFLFGALELSLNHMVSLSLSAWLITLALLGGAGMLADWYGGRRAKEEVENAGLLGLGDPRTHHLQVLYGFGLIIALLVLGAVAWLGSLEATDGLETGRGRVALLIVLLAGAGVGGNIGLNMRTWAQVVAYAHTGRASHPQETQARSTDSAEVVAGPGGLRSSPGLESTPSGETRRHTKEAHG